MQEVLPAQLFRFHKHDTAAAYDSRGSASQVRDLFARTRFQLLKLERMFKRKLERMKQTFTHTHPRTHARTHAYTRTTLSAAQEKKESIGAKTL